MPSIFKRTQGRIVLGVAVLALVALVSGGIYLHGGARAPQRAAVAPTLPPATSPDTITFTIDPTASAATFTINEVHFGQPTVVVGKTTHVAGQLQINKNDPSQTRIGQITVDLSTLATDISQRDDETQAHILETGTSGNQLATFTATSISGLPATFSAGQAVPLKITGNLKIHGVTRQETFDATVTGVSAALVTGEAHVTVRYSDFGITIPRLPFSVASVEPTVVLAIQFTARAG
ncbi:MAG TPA: YceI family protein [Ktedonobacterales bacterium]|nr:YceI family protein [Ktedonobacterales bacterium]